MLSLSYIYHYISLMNDNDVKYIKTINGLAHAFSNN